MNKFGRFVGTLLYAMFVAYAIYWGEGHLSFFPPSGSIGSNIYSKTLLGVFYPVVIGILVGLPKLLEQVKKKGFWKLDWINLLAIGIPAFLMGIYPILVFLPGLSPPLPVKLPLLGLYYANQVLVTLSGIVFGYLLVTAPFKRIIL